MNTCYLVIFVVMFLIQSVSGSAGATTPGLTTPFFPFDHLTGLIIGKTKAKANATDADANYLKFTTYLSNTSPCEGDSIMGATLTDMCQVINSTMSQKLTCKTASTCTFNQFDNEDCSGQVINSLDFITDGNCDKVVSPLSDAPQYMKVTQVVGQAAAMYVLFLSLTTEQVEYSFFFLYMYLTLYLLFSFFVYCLRSEGLATPYLGMWDEDDCSGNALTFSSMSGCHAGQGEMSFQTTCGVSGSVESCYWKNSTTCSPSAGKNSVNLFN